MGAPAPKKVSSEILEQANSVSWAETERLRRWLFQLGQVSRSGKSGLADLIARAFVNAKPGDREAALADITAAHGLRHSDDPGQRINIAINMLDLGKFDQAVEMAQEFLNIPALRQLKAVQDTAFHIAFLSGDLALIQLLDEIIKDDKSPSIYEWLQETGATKAFQHHQKLVAQIFGGSMCDASVSLIAPDEHSYFIQIRLWTTDSYQTRREKEQQVFDGMWSYYAAEGIEGYPLLSILSLTVSGMHDEAEDAA